MENVSQNSKALQIFSFKDQPIRVVLIDGEPWWVITDVCKILEIRNVGNATNRLDQEGIRLADTLTKGGKQKVKVANEPNLYRLIFRSDKPEAEAFQKWVFEDVLPSIRKTGNYSIQPSTQVPFLNTLWTRRALIFNEKTQIPEGYWCVFNEIGHICWQMELKDIHLTEESTPDISVGRLWCKHLRGLGKDMSLIREYDHYYPPDDRRRVQRANIYPNAWLGDFRDWFQKQYLKVEFKKYLATHMLINGELPAPKTPRRRQLKQAK